MELVLSRRESGGMEQEILDGFFLKRSQVDDGCKKIGELSREYCAL